MSFARNSSALSPIAHMGWGQGSGENAKLKTARNTHTEGYDDDGLVITMTLSKFFSALRDYSSFLNDGYRPYISLTNEEGDEVFQFGLTNTFQGNAGEDISRACHVSSRNSKGNIQTLKGLISDSDAPILMQSPHGNIYGVLYPSVTLCLPEPK